MKRVRYIFAAGVVSAVMAMSIPVYADRSGKVELPQDSTDYYMTVDSGGVGVDIYPETSDKSEKLNDKRTERFYTLKARQRRMVKAGDIQNIMEPMATFLSMS